MRITRSFLKEQMVSLALLVSMGMIGFTVLRYNDARDAISYMENTYKRAQVQDRLIGRQIDLTDLGAGIEGLLGEEGSTRTVLWIVDVERCRGCLNELGAWRRLERLTNYSLILLLIGDPSAYLQQSLKIFSRTNVRKTTRSKILATVGPLLPNTKLLLASSGIALLVDSRATGQTCGWSFEAQVGAFAGINAPRAIRIVQKVTF